MFLGLFKKSTKVVKVKRKAKKTTGKAKAKPVKSKKTRAKKPAARPAKAMPQIIGEVTHYFPHVKAGVISITKGKIAVGDTLQFKGHTTSFKQKVRSMQINNTAIKEAKPGDEVGLLVKSRVRHNDTVYKL